MAFIGDLEALVSDQTNDQTDAQLQQDALCLTGCDGHFSNNVIIRAAAGQVVQRLCQALKHRTVGTGTRQTLDQFVSNITGIQVREDQHICLTADGTAGSLLGVHRRHQSGIRLQFAVGENVQTFKNSSRS